MARRVGIYARLSKRPAAVEKDYQAANGQHGDTPATERQFEDCDHLAEANGWEVVRHYEDADRSAYKRSVVRDEFEAMLLDMEAGVIEAVLVWRSDRLVRQPRDLDRFLDAAEKHKVDLVSVTEALDITTGSGLFMLQQFTLFAHYSSKVQSERGKRMHASLAKQGKPATRGGTRPFGYAADRTTVVPEEAELIREAADWILSGRKLHGLAQDWARRGVRSPASKQCPEGKPWSARDLRKMMSKARLWGMREHAGAEVGPAVWEPILTPEQGARLRAILHNPAHPRAGQGLPPRSYLLTGIAKCGLCGTPLVGQRNDSGTPSYLCVKDAVTGGCGRLRCVADPVAEVVAGMCFEALDSPRFERARARRSAAAAKSAKRAVDHSVRLLEDRESLARLTEDYYAHKSVDKASYQRTKAVLDARIVESDKALQHQTGGSAVDCWVGRGADLQAEWDDLPLHRKIEVVSALIEQVPIAPAPFKGAQFSAKRVGKPVWRL
jgi:DNA invertase Pin-like site-specific DNA recombinase